LCCLLNLSKAALYSFADLFNLIQLNCYLMHISFHSFHRVLICTLIFLFTESYNATAQIWSKRLGGIGSEQPTCIVRLPDGGSILTASVSAANGDIRYNRGGTDAWVARLDSVGDIIWQKTFGGLESDVFQHVERLADGSFLVGGAYSTSPFAAEYYTDEGTGVLLHLSGNGDVLWEKRYPNLVIRHFSVNTDGTIILLGSTRDTTVSGFNKRGVNVSVNYNSDISIIKTTATGTVLWQKAYGTIGEEFGRKVRIASDGRLIVAGATSNSQVSLSADAFLLNLTPDGNVIWQKQFGETNSTENAKDIVLTPDGGFLMLNTTAGDNVTNFAKSNIWAVKLNALGTMVWNRFYGNLSREDACTVIPLADGSFCIVGETGLEGIGNNASEYSWIFRIDSNGIIQTNHQRYRLSNTYNYQNRSAVFNPADSTVLVAAYHSSGSDAKSIYIAKESIRFPLPVIQNRLVLKTEPSMGGTVTGGGLYNPNTQVPIRAVPNPNWRFVAWMNTNGTVHTTSSESYKYLINSVDTLVALFSQRTDLVSVQLSPSGAGIKTVSGSGVYSVGQAVTIRMNLDSGYRSLGWQVYQSQNNGYTTVSTDNEYTFTVEKDTIFYANTSPSSDIYSARIELSVYPPNTGTVAGAGTYPRGFSTNNPTITATAKQGWIFDHWRTDQNRQYSCDPQFVFKPNAIRQACLD
jgi:hypothetical protein